MGCHPLPLSDTTISGLSDFSDHQGERRSTPLPPNNIPRGYIQCPRVHERCPDACPYSTPTLRLGWYYPCIPTPPPAELTALMLEWLDANYMTCCQKLDIPKTVKRLGLLDPSKAKIRDVEYKFVEPEVSVPQSVAKPKPKPGPKNAPMQRRIASYIQPQPPSDAEA